MQCLTSGKRSGVSTRSRQRDQLASDGTGGIAAKICNRGCYLFPLDVVDALTHRLHVGRGSDRGGRERVRPNAISALRLRYGAHERDDAALRRRIAGDSGHVRTRKRGFRSEVDDRTAPSTKQRKKRAGHEIGGREIDRDHAMPGVYIALRQRSAQRETTRDVDEPGQPITVLVSHAIRETADGGGVREIAAERERTKSRDRERGCARAGGFGSPIHQEERCPRLGKRARDHFADLPFSARSSQKHRVAEIVFEHGTEYVYDPLGMPTSRHYSFAERLERLGIVIVAILVLYLAFVGLLSITRGTPVQTVIAEGDRSGPPPPTDSLFARTMEMYTGTHVGPGTRVEAVNNGTVYDSLWKDLREAKQSISVQMYYSLPGKVADTLAAILKERARAKVRVLLLLDAFGSQNLKRKWADDLRAAGVELALLRKLRWYSIHNATDRSHVRVVVVDGKIGYTGGFGLADYWLGDGLHEEQWRESNVRFEGPAVMQLEAAFASAWAEATGELLTGDIFFPARGFAPVPGGVQAGLPEYRFSRNSCE